MVFKFQLCVLCQTKIPQLKNFYSYVCNLLRDTRPLLKPHNLSSIHAISPQHVTQPLPKSQNLSYNSCRLSYSHPFSAYVTSSIQAPQPLTTSHNRYSSLANSDHITQPLLVSCNLSFGSVVTQPLLGNSQKYRKKIDININIPVSNIEQLPSKSKIIQFSKTGVCDEQGQTFDQVWFQ